MNLSALDQRELLIPLYAGVYDEAQWRSFLERVKRRIGAAFACIITVQDDTPVHLARQVFAGRNLRVEAEVKGLNSLYDNYAPPFRSLRPNRVYHLQELMSVDAKFRAFTTIHNQALGVSDARFVRVQGRDKANGWLMVSRETGSFSAADGALLSALGPHLATALRNYVLVQNLQLRAAMAHEALSRAGGGWLLLGREARIIDIDPGLSALLERIGASSEGQRLHLPHAQARQFVVQAAQDFASDPAAEPRAFTMSVDPRVDALLVPVTGRDDAAAAGAVMLLMCRTPPTNRGDRRPLLQELFGLSRRESELALLLADGQALGQAASTMGVTEETARGYLKAIFAKMDCHSQSELVRRIFMSVVDFA